MLKLIQIINTGEWYKVEDQTFIKNLTKPEVDNLKLFQRIKDELTLNADQDILLKQNRIVIPQVYQHTVVKLAHIGFLKKKVTTQIESIPLLSGREDRTRDW